MPDLRRRDGFIGEKQINVPTQVVDKYLKNRQFLHALYITYIGFYPKASFHYHERKNGCGDNILFYCLAGKGYYDTHLGSFELTANHFTVLPAHHFHRYQADIHDPWTIYWVHFSGSRLAELNTFLEIDRYVPPVPIRYDERFVPAWEEMYNALKNGYTLPNISHANLCLYRFISLYMFPDVRVYDFSGEDPIAESIRYLKSHIDKMTTVEDLAVRSCYSTSHFSTLFKNRTGFAPVEYSIQLKIHYACQLLDQSALRIKEVAARVGYGDPYYFSRLFCRIMGVSPKKYRERKIDK